MRRVLIIAYFFPPDGGAGTQRMAKFCKYLGGFGWEPIVVTRTRPSEMSCERLRDETLLADVGPQTRVVRVPEAARPYSWAAALPTIDVALGWLPAAFDAARDAADTFRPDVVLVTMSPFDLCFVGRRLHEVTHLPVVYDLRDPWALDGWRLHGTKRRWKRDYRAMVETIAHAHGVIANTPESAEAIRGAVPRLEGGRLIVIPNGFDSEDLAPRLELPCRPGEDDHFCIVHTGTLHASNLYRYGGLLGRLRKLRHYRPEPIDASGRTPFYLLKAVGLLREEGHPLASKLRIVFVGRADHAITRCVMQSGVAEQVEFTGYVSHEQSVAWLHRADALFLPLHGLPKGRRALIVPGKTYEYLAARRPILACLPPGDARDLVDASGLGFCADPCDVHAIVGRLRELYDQRTSQSAVPEPPPWLRSYERRELTGRLAQFLDQIAAMPHPSPC